MATLLTIRSTALATTLLVAATAAAEPLTATVDRTETTVGSPIRLTVTIEGSDYTQPQLPEVPGFQVHTSGTSRQMKIINGAVSSSISFNYLLVPHESGTVTVGPVQATIDGRTYQSKPFQVRVLAAGEAPKGGGTERDLFVTAQVSNERPFVGEQVIYTLRFYRRVRIAGADADIPTFEGFLTEDLGEQRSYTSVVRGKEYEVTEIRRALFPQQAGKLTIPATSLTVEVVQRRRNSWFMDPFGSMGGPTQTVVARSAPIEMEVRPLPPAPRGFSGLVGSFKVSAQLSKRELSVGESTTLTITISGSGNVRQIPKPQLGDLADFKHYDDKPATKVDASASGLKGNKVYRTALVPRRAGELTLPPIKVIYFNPQAGNYQTAASSPITLSVTPSAESEDLKLTEVVGAGSGKVAVKVIADDIRPVYTGLDALQRQALTLTAQGAVAAGMFFPPGLFLIFWFWRRRAEAEASDENLKRRRVALKNALKALSGLPTQTASPEAAKEASRLLRAFLGDALGVEGLALTPPEAEQRLLSHGTPAELATRVRSLLQALEAAQFGAGQLAADVAGSLPSQLKQLMTDLDKLLPRQQKGGKAA